MATKKTQQGAPKKASTKTGSLLNWTKKDHEAAAKRVDADMKKHGFKTLDELMDYYDSKRGY